MWPDRVSNPGPPTYESGALPIALRGPAANLKKLHLFLQRLSVIKDYELHNGVKVTNIH